MALPIKHAPPLNKKESQKLYNQMSKSNNKDSRITREHFEKRKLLVEAVLAKTK